MITVIPSDQRHHVETGWLSSYWHFSFSDYYDPQNMNFGALRVFNDDVFQPGHGFDMHAHRDMEIVTYIIDGALEHRDHLGNRGVIRSGDVQVMSAGRGIRHAEMNPSSTTPVHLLQLWILPRNKGGEPRYEDRRFEASQRRNRLLPVVSSGEVPGTLRIDQDATIYVSNLDANQTIPYQIKPGRRAYVFVIDGHLMLNGQLLSAGDQARITNESQLQIAAAKDTHLMLIDLP